MNTQELKGQLKLKLEKVFTNQEAKNMSVWLIEDGLDLPISIDTSCSDEVIQQSNLMVQEIISGKPFDYVIGHSVFYGLSFTVNEHVLIPRPETEELVEQAMLWLKNRTNEHLTILDIGTGSGCIPITIAHKFPLHQIVAIDVSPQALQVAEVNAMVQGVQIEFLQEDALNFSSAFLDRKWDLIISNPPYILEEEKELMSASTLDFEPKLALFAQGEDPLVFYKEIAKYAKTNLNERGALMMEMNEFKAPEIFQIIQEEGLQNVIMKKDLSGKDRMILADQV